MNDQSELLGTVNEPTRRLTAAWMALGIYALLAAGLLSLSLALSRTPALQDLMPGEDFFRVALVVHVDLSILIWFLASIGILWSVLGTEKKGVLHGAAFVLMFIGTVMLSVAPFVGANKPLMNDYIPVLQHPWFLSALAIIAIAAWLQASLFLFHNFPTRWRGASLLDAIRFASFLGAISLIIAIVSFAASYSSIDSQLAGKYFYDLLFWAGGHILQFTYTDMMLVCWALLTAACGARFSLSPRSLMVLFSLVVLPLLVVPALYRYPVDSTEHILGFTQLMRLGGLASIPVGFVLLITLLKRDSKANAGKWQQQAPLFACMIVSVTLFAGGGFLGFMIQGSNTVIPAHYHGSIIGVTIAFMGAVYLLLPVLGKPITRCRMAHWQPYLYGGGQILHITALAWTGGYGVKRKTAGSAQGLESAQEIIGMGLMGLGGLISVLGGLAFLIVVISALLNKKGS